jgi:hypothetical protein
VECVLVERTDVRLVAIDDSLKNLMDRCLDEERGVGDRCDHIRTMANVEGMQTRWRLLLDLLCQTGMVQG